MDEKIIGSNIRELRLSKEASLTEVAKRAGITKSTLSKIETGQISSPISTLISIASALGAHLSDFVREDVAPKKVLFTPKGKGKLLVRGGTRLGYTYESLAVGYPGRKVEPFILTISPENKEGEFKHEGEEFIYMLSGEMEFTIANTVYHLKAGDSLYFDATQPHKTRLVGEKPARFLSCFVETP